MTKRFESKTALVTGGASGIGKAVALALAAEGANVVIFDLHLEPAQAVVDEIAATGARALAVAGNVAQPDDVRAAVDAAVNTFGALHAAFNNAGVGGPLGLLGDITIEGYLQLIDVNLHSVFYGMFYEIPAMLKAGGGAIVNTSSILGLVGESSAVPYTTAKHGIAGMTKAAAIGYASRGVRINSVHPGYIDTPLLEGIPQEKHDGLVALHPIGRLGTAEEVAQYVVFLLSDDASFITGSQAVIDGGYTAR